MDYYYDPDYDYSLGDNFTNLTNVTNSTVYDNTAVGGAPRASVLLSLLFFFYQACHIGLESCVLTLLPCSLTVSLCVSVSFAFCWV